jgi:hypothetical protein
MTFLKRRISVAIWELLLIFIAAIIFATVYRIYFSRAVALTEVCERFETLQNGDAFNKLDTSDSLNDINRLCQLRRPMRQ